MENFGIPDKGEEAHRCMQEGYEKQMAGETDAAVELFLKSIAFYPTAEAHTLLGWAYSLKGRFGDAIRECEKAVRIDPEYGNPYNDIGAYLIETGRWKDAIPWLEKATVAARLGATKSGIVKGGGPGAPGQVPSAAPREIIGKAYLFGTMEEAG